MKHTQIKNNGRKRHMRMLAILLVPAIALIIGAAAPKVWADDPVCWWNIEFNASDGDAGVRGFFDYEPWKELEIENPRGRTIVEVEAEKSMKRQGLAEWFFESGEPTLLEVSFKTFLRRFRPGFYEFEAETIERDEVECEEELTHVIPCAPVIDAEEKNGDIIITWLPVTTVVNTADTDENVAAEEPDEWDVEDLLVCDDSFPLKIIGYEVIVETEHENRYTIELPGDSYSVTVPPEFLALGGSSFKFQYEVIAIEESGNQTITEEEFCLEEDYLECPDDDE